MYQELEIWKLKQAQINHDKEIDELCTKEMSAKEFDKQLDKIAKKYFPNE